MQSPSWVRSTMRTRKWRPRSELGGSTISASRGSRTWRRMGVHLTKRGWLTEVAHAFDHHNASLSEGEPLTAVVGALAGKLYWRRVGTDSRVGCTTVARRRPACPRVARCAAPGGGGSGGSDPGFFAAGAAPGRGRWCTSKFTISPPRRVAPSTVIPGGKAIERCRGQRGSTDQSGPRLPPAR